MGKTDKKFSKVLCHLVREEKQLKQAQVIKKTGIPQSTVSAIMNGTRGINTKRRKLIAECFKMSVDEFLSYLDNHKEKSNPQDEKKKCKNNLTVIHQDLVSKFKDKDEGYAANKALLAIEEIDEYAFLDVVKDLKKIAKHLKEAKKNGVPATPGRWVIDNVVNQD